MISKRIFKKRLLRYFGINVRNLSLSFFFRKRIHFIHIGRTGGSVLRDALLKINLTQKKYFFCVYGHDFQAFNLKKKDKYIIIFRDPLKRFVSSFYSRKFKNISSYTKTKLPKEEENILNTFQHANDLAESLCSNDENVKKKAIQAISTLKNVKDKYIHYINLKFMKKHPPLFIFKTESLEDDFSKFIKFLDIKTDISLSKDKNIMKKNDYKNIPNLSNLSVSNLTKWYKDDILLYNSILSRK